MLPKIHLGTLMTVTDSHLANQTRECRQAQMEARAHRNMEGFYIYQNYLKRLRRMHRAYVTRFKTQQKQKQSLPQQRPQQIQHGSWSFQSQLDPIQTATTSGYGKVHHGNFDFLNRGQSNLPQLKHRFSLSQPPTNSPSPDWSGHSSPHSPSFKTSPQSKESVEGKSDPEPHYDEYKDNDVSTKASFSIHIPCGREESFDDSPVNDKRTFHKGDEALPFRMWKQRQEQSGRPSVYSLEPPTGGSKAERHEVYNNTNTKAVLKTTVVGPDLNYLLKQNK